MKKKTDETGREVITVWEAFRPRTIFEWAVMLLIAVIASALAFGVGVWAGGFIW